jgi:primosomal protein N'
MPYQILPEQKIPGYYLTYTYGNEKRVGGVGGVGKNLDTKEKSSENIPHYDFKLPPGQVIEAPINKRPVRGLVVNYLDESQLNFKPEKLKPIGKVLPYRFTQTQLTFLRTFAQNTFNNLNHTVENFLQPLKLLTKKNWETLEAQWQERYLQLQTDNSKQSNQDSQKPEVAYEENSKSSNNSESSSAKQAGSHNHNFSTKPFVDFVLDSNLRLRIRYIIRTKMENLKNTKNTFYKEKNGNLEDNAGRPKNDQFSDINFLIIFPEKKYLDKIFYGCQEDYKEIYKSIAQVVNDSLPETKFQLNFFRYSGDASKFSKESVRHLLLPKNKKKNSQKQSEFQVNLYFATRAGLFLPFSRLDQLILIDEANPMHIQDQGKVYFDSRDVIYIMSQIYQTDLIFLSTLPSVRLHSFYSQKIFEEIKTNYTAQNQKPLTIKITKRDRQSSKNELFSHQVEEILED